MYKDGEHFPLFFVDRKEIYDAMNLRPSEHFSREDAPTVEDRRVLEDRLLADFMPNLLKALEK